MIDNVIEFNTVFKVSKDRDDLYIKLIEEEFEEWLEEAYKKEKAPEKELKEICDLLYVIFGYTLQRNWDVVSAFNRVHKSNMSKLGPDGEPILNEHGKIQKGDGYILPNLKDLV